MSWVKVSAREARGSELAEERSAQSVGDVAARGRRGGRARRRGAGAIARAGRATRREVQLRVVGLEPVLQALAEVDVVVFRSAKENRVAFVRPSDTFLGIDQKTNRMSRTHAVDAGRGERVGEPLPERRVARLRALGVSLRSCFVGLLGERRNLILEPL